MDHKKSPKGKKGRAKQVEDHLWECSACTYRNNPEAFKCSMCSIRKGTSTRKPKLNPDMVEVQVQKHAFTPPPLVRFPRGDEHPRPSSSNSNDHYSYQDEEEMAGPSAAAPSPAPSSSSSSSLPKAKKLKNGGVTKQPRAPRTPTTSGSKLKLKNIDRKNGTVHSVTVDNVTINITEYKIKSRKDKKVDAEGSHASNLPSDADSDTQDHNTSIDSFKDTRSS